MSLTLVPPLADTPATDLGETPCRTEEQLALFGDPVDVPVFPRRPELTLEEAAAEVAEIEGQMDLFFETYAHEDRTAVVAGLYFDPDGRPQTRYNRLRVVQ